MSQNIKGSSMEVSRKYIPLLVFRSQIATSSRVIGRQIRKIEHPVTLKLSAELCKCGREWAAVTDQSAQIVNPIGNKVRSKAVLHRC